VLGCVRARVSGYIYIHACMFMYIDTYILHSMGRGVP